MRKVLHQSNTITVTLEPCICIVENREVKGLAFLKDHLTPFMPNQEHFMLSDDSFCHLSTCSNNAVCPVIMWDVIESMLWITSATIINTFKIVTFIAVLVFSMCSGCGSHLEFNWHIKEICCWNTFNYNFLQSSLKSILWFMSFFANRQKKVILKKILAIFFKYILQSQNVFGIILSTHQTLWLLI